MTCTTTVTMTGSFSRDMNGQRDTKKSTFPLKKMSNIYANSVVVQYTWLNTLT